MGAAEILAAGGIQRSGEVVELAGAAGADLASMATMLTKESGGGYNVWGHDGVNTGGIYVKGGAVTRDAYLAYKAQRSALGAQGVGPTQLTWSGYQDQADAAGGCWDWRANCLVGFRALAGLQRSYGIRNGFRSYNGSGTAAENYADQSMALYNTWLGRLRGSPQGGVTRPEDLPTLVYGQTSSSIGHLQDFCNRYPWNPVLPILPVTGYFGDMTKDVVRRAQAIMGVTGPDAVGSPVGPRTNRALWDRGYRG